MEILKKSIVLLMLFCSNQLIAQHDAVLQKAFSESYTAEYNKNYSEAISNLTKLGDENSYEINLRIGWLYLLNKNYNQSVTHYQKAIDLKPYSLEAKLGYAKTLAAQESWDKLFGIYEQIIKIDDLNYTANYWIGVINYNRKKYETAIKHFEKLVNLYPFDYDANHMMAWSCLMNGRNNDAKILFNKALLIKPNDASCLDGLSRIK